MNEKEELEGPVEVDIPNFKGNGGYIQFVPRDLIMKPVQAHLVQIRIDYDDGYAEIGMDYAYTLRMLSNEFRALTSMWNIYPRICVYRDNNGVVIRETDIDSNGKGRMNDEILVLPPRIQEEATRGTEINLREDQTFLLLFLFFYIYLVWPQRGTRLHRTTARSAGCGVVQVFPMK
jgi:hypothetical protein